MKNAIEIQKMAMAGTLESSDCLITVSPDDELTITIESVALSRFGKHIKALVEECLLALNVKNGKIEIVDKGALDYCLRARLETAIKRGAEIC